MKRIIFLLMALLMVVPLAQAAWGQNLQDYFKQGNKKVEISDYRGALEAWEKGLATANRMGNKVFIAIFLGSIGLVYDNLGDYPKALSYFEQSLKISREIGKRNFEMMDLGNIGWVYRNLGDYPKALTYYEQSLKISREIGYRNFEGMALNRIGIVYKDVADYPKALSYHEQSLKINRELGDRKGEGGTLNIIALAYQDLADYPKALSYHEQSLKIKREMGDRKGEGDTLNSIGSTYMNLGEYDKALSYFEQTLKISREIGNRKGEGMALNSIGIVYKDVADYPKALTYYEQSLKISRELGDKKGEGVTLMNIGGVYHYLGDHPKALTYSEQSLMINRELGNRKGEGETLNNIGAIYMNLGEYDKALSYFEQSLKVTKDIRVSTSIVYVEANMCNIYLEQGRFKEASEVFQRLNEYYKANPDIRFNIPFGRYYLRTGDYRKAKEKFADTIEREEAREMFAAHFLFSGYVGLGLSYEGLRDYPKAMECFQKGIDLIEKQRGALGGAERERYLEAKVGFFPRLEPYNGMIRALIKEKEKDYQKNSLFFAERGKSRVFLEMLATRGLKGKGKTEEDTTILEKEKEYQEELRVIRKRMEVLEGLGAKAPQGGFPQLKKELENKEIEFERFIKEVKLKNSELASFISVSPTPIEKIQSLLDQDTTLLEYYSTEDTLYAWLLTKDNIKVYEITIKEKDLTRKLDEFLLPNISTRSIKVVPVITMPVGEEYKKETPEKEREKNRQNFIRAASELYQLIMAPFEKEIKTRNLIIVPHGALHKVPFSTLSDGQGYIIDKYAISVLPAASVIEHIVKKRKAEKETLLVFANPKTEYVPLEFAEIEGKTISKLFPQNEVYSREKATETIAKKKVSSFNIVHFATHGEFNDRQPLQSGLLLAKDGENDGYLQVHEIFGMDLRNANLVTLSACETALAKIMGGDDLVGLSRGFIYAGTPSLLATLWKVDDPATYKLMEYFYQNWKQGMSKPEALRRAQIALRNWPQYNHPYYWAPFVMIGDWQ